MSPGFHGPSYADTRIEQALAFGRSLDWMRARLGASPRDVDRVMKRMDAINNSPDCEPAKKPYRKTGPKR